MQAGIPQPNNQVLALCGIRFCLTLPPVSAIVALSRSAGAAVQAMAAFVKDNGLDPVEPIVDAGFAGTPEQIEQCHKRGRKMVERLGALSG